MRKEFVPIMDECTSTLTLTQTQNTNINTNTNGNKNRPITQFYCSLAALVGAMLFCPLLFSYKIKKSIFPHLSTKNFYNFP